MHAIRWRWYVLASAALLVCVSLPAAYYAAHPEVVRTFLVEFTGMQRFQQDVFVDPAMTGDARIRLQMSLALGRQRVADVFGEVLARPIVIATWTPSTATRFGIDPRATGFTRLTWTRSFIVLGPRGINVDVLAHEIAHAELSQRIRRFRLSSVVPPWFSEGLAMLVDRRPQYSRGAYGQLVARGVRVPGLGEISTAEGFYSGDADATRMAYIVSKAEVQRWFALVGRNGLLRLIENISTGQDFARRYRAIEAGAGAGRLGR